MNGIIPSDHGPSIWILAAILNSRLLNFLFRLGSVPFQNAFCSANKQFIAPLPIRVPDAEAAETLEGLSRHLHAATRDRNTELHDFRVWLTGFLDVPLKTLTGYTALNQYDELGMEGVMALLKRNRNRISINPDSRNASETIHGEFNQSLEKLNAFNRVITECEPMVDQAIFDLYEMTDSQRAAVNAEYDD